eukprot:CAMPEP_0198322478 /NCGR_PEP_ID=MMETSP1450-20131203/10942_1 /TAXON_ID=753684 ORGANISM="Madagascaria erythrocladiodes, Strain CCMP3234" /NCGR_SAMPLE_ID=MMETSP1450 /ASSEMBLY_ACC=CAM_ASM_001115 /LENGTH=389 /DNA_ID=CAMNT_0044026097 /DNA_START=94 /DNA_END=1266 /DNA_ORIENTATION=-
MRATGNANYHMGSPFLNALFQAQPLRSWLLDSDYTNEPLASGNDRGDVHRPITFPYGFVTVRRGTSPAAFDGYFTDWYVRDGYIYGNAFSDNTPEFLKHHIADPDVVASCKCRFVMNPSDSSQFFLTRWLSDGHILATMIVFQSNTVALFKHLLCRQRAPGEIPSIIVKSLRFEDSTIDAGRLAPSPQWGIHTAISILARQDWGVFDEKEGSESAAVLGNDGGEGGVRALPPALSRCVRPLDLNSLCQLRFLVPRVLPLQRTDSSTETERDEASSTAGEMTEGHEFNCPTCGAVFKSRKNLTRHELRHKNVGSFPCRFCNKRFWQTAHLRLHVSMVHEKKKPFSCGLCSRKFSSRSNTLRHLRSVHGLASAENISGCVDADVSAQEDMT